MIRKTVHFTENRKTDMCATCQKYYAIIPIDVT